MSINKLNSLDEFTKCRHSDSFQYSLSALPIQAKRVLYLIMAQIFASQKPNEKELTFEIHASDFKRICNVERKYAYRALEEATIFLQKSVIYENIGDDFSVADAINITRRVRYHRDQGYCSIMINSDVYPYFFELSKSFTTNNLYEVARISDNMVGNLHQVIMKRYSKYKSNKNYELSFIISVNDLKDELWLFKMVGKKKEYKYKSLPEFKRYLKKLFKEIEKETSLSYIFFEDYKKSGRNVTHLKINYLHNDTIEREIKKMESVMLDRIEQDLYIN